VAAPFAAALTGEAFASAALAVGFDGSSSESSPLEYPSESLPLDSDDESSL
jgi:hypothetical protein